jgi:hypothetical protein
MRPEAERIVQEMLGEEMASGLPLPVPKRPANKGSFQPGKSGNPGGRRKVRFHVAEYAAQYAKEAIDSLVRVIRDPNAKPVETTAAARELLDRGVGKPVSAIELTGRDEVPLANLANLSDADLATLERLRVLAESAEGGNADGEPALH